MQIHNIIDSLKNEPSTNNKIQILKKHSNNDVLKEYIYLTLSPKVRYWQKPKNIPLISDLQRIQSKKPYIAFQEALEKLNKVRYREITGFDARDYILSIFEEVTQEDEILLRNLLDADLKCGVNYGLVNKVWKDLIQYPRVQLADTDLTRINYPAYSQLKADGTRVLFQDGVFQTRNGLEVKVFENFDYLTNLLKSEYGYFELDGEFICYENNQPLDRKTSNGIINKAIQGTISKEEAQKIVYLVWDLITPENSPYEIRLNSLHEIVNSLDEDNLMIIESKLVQSYDEAVEHFNEVRAKDLEGTILKNTQSLFEDKRSKNLCKMKAEYEADLKVLGFEYGTGKNSHRVGNLILESQDSKVQVSCGIFKDMPEEVRDELLTNMPEVVTVRYNERIKSKAKDTQSLFLPRIIALRYDKNEADALDKMIKGEKIK